MVKWKNQIDEWELHEIRILIMEWLSIPEVADRIWRNKSTLYRLFVNNWIRYNEKKFIYVWGKSWKPLLREKWKRRVQFVPRHVFLLRENRRREASRRYCRIMPWWKLEKYILERIIRDQWSSKQISGRWRLEKLEPLSKDTIYRYIYSNHFHLVRKFFRRKWKRYQHWRKNKYQLQDRTMIDLRPEIINRRERFWDWEWDTIVWIRWWSNQVILTNVERRSWYLLAKKLLNWTWENVLNSTIELFSKMPKRKIKTITYDNWREFSEHRMIEFHTKLKVYFAHPYSSWERWTNENTNWLLRQYMPKKTDFKDVSDVELDKYVKLLNNRPRERLWFLTPHEVFIKWKSCIWL
ncbi:MAG: IS30 family transposase [uncultured bacterium (gcode 4)]|uniref:IS30 family transposase n=1 Tax=uncultured bacterium (gcode 4) TaxID=1234023 RepID=K2FXE8_9BACT|nr:MAG: IS30 family transposase [uncultured bacterium (gcode 4)]